MVSVSKNYSQHVSKPLRSSKVRMMTTGTLFFIFLTAAILVFADDRSRQVLSISFFLIVGACLALIAIQILFLLEESTKGQYFVLFEIAILSFVVSCSFLLLYPGYQGGDSAYHIGFINSILSNGNFNSWFGHYNHYPFYQILFVDAISIVGLSIRESQIILALVQILFLIFPFLLMRRFFGPTAGLLAALFLSMAPNLFGPKFTFFPGAFSAILIILTLFIMLYPTEKNPEIFLCLIIGLIATVLVHPLSSFFIVVIMAIIVTMQKALRVKSIRWAYPIGLLIMVMTIIMWTRPLVEGGDLFSLVTNSFFDSLFTVDVSGIDKATLSQQVNWADMLMNDLGLAILIALGIIGAFMILRTNATSRNKEGLIDDFSVILSSIALVIIPIPFVLTIVYPDGLPNRWFVLVEILASMTASLAVIFIVRRGRRKVLVRSGLVAMISLMLMLMVTSPMANPSTKVFSSSLSNDPAARMTEITGAGFMNAQHYEKVASSSWYSNAISIYNTWLGPHSWINPEVPLSYEGLSIIISDNDLQNGFIIPLYGAGQLLETVYPDDRLRSYLHDASKIYSNENSWIYQ
ncbi:MAG: hypothetical protein GXX95_03125 [Methanomassiliicoccus sp.]|nr:hypothetical protein [Methanomassiliicoccus sp.]